MKVTSLLRMVAVGVLMAAPSLVSADVVADSVADWSADGTQGANGWTNGFYDASADTDGAYGAGDFQAFAGPTWVWAGSNWDEANTDGDNVPWTTVAQESGHPNGDNNGVVHHAVRRWESDYSGDATVSWNLAKQNANCGNGTTGLLYLNGSLLDEFTVGGTDATGVTRSVDITLASGDVLDLALSPLGTDGTLADGCDGSFFGMQVNAVPEPNCLALLFLGVLPVLRRRK